MSWCSEWTRARFGRAQPKPEPLPVEVGNPAGAHGLDPLVFGTWPGTYDRTPDGY